MAGKRWTTWAVVLGCWTLLTLVYSSHLYVYHNLHGQGSTWPHELAEAAADFYVWAALTPAILWLARRFPPTRERWPVALAVHLPLCLVFSFVHLGLHAVVDQTLVHGHYSLESIAGQGRILLARTYHFGLLVYAGIVAIAWTIDFFRDQQVRASQLEARLAEARLEALRSQLHPHFLFNTLHAVSTLMHRDVKAADRMIARLAELLRATLSGEADQEVSLASELAFLEKYIDIERVRFEDRLTVELLVAPDTLEARVPNFVLQPLVENSIRHGFSKRRGAGRVEIRAEREDGSLRLVVRDDGPGLPDGWREGIGLRNTRLRLEQLYGPGQRLELAPVPEGGLEVTLTIPFRAA